MNPARSFYLGTHAPNWLALLRFPLFVSRRRIARSHVRRFPRAVARWALDSGGFSELSLHGSWRTTAERYVAEVRLWRDEIGKLEWAAVQDWMCEPFMLKKTGLSIAEHQRRTVQSYLELRGRAPEIQWLPVLQGWALGDYLRHVDVYRAAGVQLEQLPLVGLGSVCRRQATDEAVSIIEVLTGHGLKLHGFGFKEQGLKKAGHLLSSSDSMAWSTHARKRPPLPGHEHKSCANCHVYASWWRSRLLSRVNA